MPPMISCQLAALLIAGLYYVWRDVLRQRFRVTRMVRERVAYMLWVAAQR